MPNTITLAGPGVLYGTRTDASGTTACNFGKVKSVDLEIAFNTKALTGQFQVPFDFLRGIAKITGKAKVAEISTLALMNLFFGVNSATGETLVQFLEPGAIPGSSTYIVTVAQSATWVATKEVLYAATGLPFTKVASAPAAGEFSEAAGVYTFAAADAGKAVLISYSYTLTGGFNFTLTNQLQGDTPTFSVDFFNTKNGKPVTLTLPFCTSDKLGRGFKEDDFVNPEFDFQVGANAAGVWLIENYPQLS
jgi:hypothetical protein